MRGTMRAFWTRGVIVSLILLGVGLLPTGRAGADPLAQWQWKNPAPQGNSIRSIARGLGSFVGVGATGTILNSLDGTKWRTHTPIGNVNDLHAVVWGKKMFVAVGALGTILTSVDGLIWTDVSAGFKWTDAKNPRPSLNAIAYGNSVFYAVGDKGTILSSSDGATWSVASSPTTVNLSGIAYNNYQFVAVGSGGTVLTLLKGGTWQAVTSNAPSALNAIAASRNLFVAVGGAGTIVTSPDGVNWTLQTSGVTTNLLGVASGNNAFVAVGTGGTVLTSDGAGVVWNAGTSGTTSDLNCISYGETNVYGTFVYVVAGSDGALQNASDPTAAWTQIKVGPGGNLKSMAFGNSAFIAVGSAGAVLYSQDGKTWTAMNSGTTADLNAVAFGNNQFVAVGAGGVVINSFDGQTWTPHFSGTRNLNGVAFDSRTLFSRFVAVGDAGTVIFSSDGINWTPLASAVTDKNLACVILGDSVLVAVGAGGTLLTSPDALIWTKRTGPTKDLKSVTVAFKPNGTRTYVVVGAGGTIFFSSDAIKWTAAKSIPTADKTVNFNAVSCDFDSTFSTFVTAGDGGVILASSDAQTWVEKPRVTANDLKGISYINKSYWAVAAAGIILNSNRLDNYILISALRKDSGQTITTDLLDFGYVDVNKLSFAVSLKISNTGQTTNLNVSGAGFDPAAPVLGAYTTPVTATPEISTSCGPLGGLAGGGSALVIAPGGSCSVDLTFAPTTAGVPAGKLQTDTFTILSDDPASPSQVSLSGTGGLYNIIQPGPNGQVRKNSVSGGVVSGPDLTVVGAMPSYFMSPAANYYTQELVVDGISKGGVPSFTFPAITPSDSPHQFQAFFSNAPHLITTNASTGGDIAPLGPVPVSHLGTQAFTIRAHQSYHLNSLVVDGTQQSLAETYTFPLVFTNHTIEADFALNRYAMTASAESNGVADAAGTGGTVSVKTADIAPVGACQLLGVNSSGLCDDGSQVTYTITANVGKGYTLKNVFVDGASVGAVTSRTFNNVIAPHTIKAIFSNQRLITVTYGGATSPSGGSVTPRPDDLTNTVSVSIGGSQTFSFIPTQGYDVLDVKVDGASMGPVTSYTFSNVQLDHALDVQFVPKTYTINVTAGPNGVIKDSTGAAVIQVKVPTNSTKVFRIVPNANYDIADVKVDGRSVGVLAGFTVPAATPVVKEGVYVFTDINSGHTLEAIFRPQYSTVTLSSAGPALPKIAALAFNITLPAGATLPLNSDPNAPLGEVDPTALIPLSGALGSVFKASVAPALDVATGLPLAAGTAQLVLLNGPGFSPGADFLKISFTSATAPPGLFVPGAPTKVQDNTGADLAGITLSANVPEQPPVTAATPPGGLYTGPQVVALASTYSTAGPIEIHYTTNGQDPSILSNIYTAPFTVAANTTVKYFAVDNSNDNQEKIRTELYVIDKNGPTAVLSGAPNPNIPTKQTSTDIMVGGTDVVSYVYDLDGSGYSAAAIPVGTHITLAGLSDQQHTLSVKGRDTAGNLQANPTTAQWKVDTTIPQTSINFPTGVYNAPLNVALANPKTTATADKAIATIYYTLDGSDPTDPMHQLKYTPGTTIPITSSTMVNFFAKDAAGNIDAPVGPPAYYSVTYTLLLLSAQSPLSPTASPDLNLVGTVSPATATVNVTLMTNNGLTTLAPAAATMTPSPATFNATWAYTGTGVLTPGINTITVTADDGLGHTHSLSLPVRRQAADGTCTTPDGDINRDGQVTMEDVNLAMRMVAGLIPQVVDSPMLTCGDVVPFDPVTFIPQHGFGVSVQGDLDVTDALFILKKVMGLSSYGP